MKRLVGLAAFLLASTAFAAGEAPPFFPQLTLLALLAAGVAYLSFRLGLVPIIGFLLAGVVAGPSVLGLVRNEELINAAAELGVILLLFAIGIEFSLDRLARIGRLIFVGGGLQVAGVIVVTTLALIPFGVALNAAIFTGCLLALSSTAIVMKLLSDKGQTSSETGQVSLGMLIFQDLAVVVMVLLVPILGGRGGSPLDIVWALGKAALLVAGVLIFARRVMPLVLEAVARTCSQEIFLLTVIAICFGTAWISSVAGVSLALGAFLAGLVVSESRFGRQALGEVLPLQILFSAAFFVSVGLLLDVRFLLANLPLVAGVLLLVVTVKALTSAFGARLLGYAPGVALGAGFLLAQIGEFSFVLERTGREYGLSPAGLGTGGTQAFIAATVVLMALTPVLARLGGTIGERFSKSTPASSTAEPHEGFGGLRDHVLIAGYGDLGRRIAGALHAADVPFGIVTLSPDGAQQAQQAGYHVMLGDYSRPYMLAEAGADRARLLIVPDDEVEMAGRVVSVVRANYPNVRVVASAEERHAHELRSAGAHDVMSDHDEVLELLAHALRSDMSETGPRPQRREERFVPAAEVSLTPSQRASSACTHTSAATTVVPRTDGCEECLASGDSWVHLRVCLTCGHVGCCDSSKNKHATKHHHTTAHPLVRSVEKGETWAWCYEDKVTL
ncbi:cation:proton antiporter [Deinococcus yavapaiensis]|uniref:Kef-type potassium/proton antiporter (CPA2 family) n=1 Tax=Deinococcus yavapaiensis KR-236 TaxID=694435 RepID=A0A318S6J8_9DEIO|nr:cation:proton antiporter [Deinococcus yavapaiensis]PYE54394.1 Kef-type potassium/proton antiporter (CPA2 family) [Deinococcus yavapaiensis KR-236]